MGKKGQSASKSAILIHFSVLQGLCPSAMQCNSSNVTSWAPCDNMQLGWHWGCY